VTADGDELVHLAVADGVATITLDSPPNRNALSGRLVTELRAHLDSATVNPAVRAIVLTHTGSTFCAGADLSEATGAGSPSPAHALLALLRRLLEVPKPVVARIDGNVRAGGLGLLGACDIVVAGPRSTFAFTEARLGLAAAIISLTLRSRMDERAAARYFLTCETFASSEAAAAGVVTMAADDADAAVGEIVARLREVSPQGLAESKWLVTAGVRRALEEDGERMVELSARLFASEEAREGMVAFLERRPPRWAPGATG
jgi:enoyl-CoA hydratase/carnithine racemase